MINYAIDPEILKPYLPKGVSLDYFKGKCYVSLVGFLFKNTRLFGIPIPLLGTFEEVNLRFYVKRTEGDSVKRGVVFINETVPYEIVAWVANKLYKEHYIAVPTEHEIKITEKNKTVKYRWKKSGYWNQMEVFATSDSKELSAGSLDEFIFEHYYGYTKVNGESSIEYRIKHPKWLTNEVLEYTINCEFKAMYGETFSFLNSAKPNSVFIAEGSAISVDWKRTAF